MGEKLVAGLVGVALVTAFALHASSLATLANSTGTAGSKLLDTAEKG